MMRSTRCANSPRREGRPSVRLDDPRDPADGLLVKAAANHDVRVPGACLCELRGQTPSGSACNWLTRDPLTGLKTRTEPALGGTPEASTATVPGRSLRS